MADHERDPELRTNLRDLDALKLSKTSSGFFMEQYFQKALRAYTEVLRPASLKYKIMDELEASLKRYRSQATPRTKILKEKKIFLLI
jgi:hypothetical protein